MPTRRLPIRPSQEHLRKLAKRRAKAEGVQLATTQRRIAAEFGHRDWASLMRAAGSVTDGRRSPLAQAATRGDEPAVRALLASGTPADGDEPKTPLWCVCDSDAPAAQRLAVAGLLLDAGASPRRTSESGATPLHAAARGGPLALVELLIRRGALSWQRDRRGKSALDYARKSDAPDRDRIVELLDRPVIRNRQFRAAVACIHAGDVDGLVRLLDAHPELLRERAVEPECYPRDYFRDPRLFWFIANNPTLMRQIPRNIAAIGQAMIARGVEKADLDYTLELVMSNGQATAQTELITLLIDAGATATPQAVLTALAHWCLTPVQTLLARGFQMTAPIAAALDRTGDLAALLRDASPEERQAAFGIAVINRRVAAARLCLDAGADPDRFLPVHRHSTALHQAAINDDVPMLELLVARGARLDVRDTLWNGTPLGWAVHNKKAAAEAFLRSVAA